jgi:hypothetical protein
MSDSSMQSFYQLALSTHDTVKSCVEFLKIPSVFEQRFDFMLSLCGSESERVECRAMLERVRTHRLQHLAESEERLARTTLNIQAFQSLLATGVGDA